MRSVWKSPYDKVPEVIILPWDKVHCGLQFWMVQFIWLALVSGLRWMIIAWLCLREYMSTLRLQSERERLRRKHHLPQGHACSDPKTSPYFLTSPLTTSSSGNWAFATWTYRRRHCISRGENSEKAQMWYLMYIKTSEAPAFLLHAWVLGDLSKLVHEICAETFLEQTWFSCTKNVRYVTDGLAISMGSWPASWNVLVLQD